MEENIHTLPTMDSLPEVPEEVVGAEQESHQDESPKPQQKQLSAEAEENIRIIREERKQFKKERDEFYRLLQEQNKAPVQSQSDDDEINLADDDIAEGKHLKRYQKKIKAMEDKLKQYEQINYQSHAEIRLKTQYPDFDKVVTQQAIETFRELYPELAASIASNNDIYTQGSSVYTLIKRFGIHKEDEYKADRDRAVTNATKPRPLTSVSPQQGETPLSRVNAFANGLTDELAEQLRKEMYEARRRM